MTSSKEEKALCAQNKQLKFFFPKVKVSKTAVYTKTLPRCIMWNNELRAGLGDAVSNSNSALSQLNKNSSALPHILSSTPSLSMSPSWDNQYHLQFAAADHAVIL